MGDAGSIVCLLTVYTLGVLVSLERDTIQIARAFGDELRKALI